MEEETGGKGEREMERQRWRETESKRDEEMERQREKNMFHIIRKIIPSSRGTLYPPTPETSKGGNLAVIQPLPLIHGCNYGGWEGQGGGGALRRG